MKIIFKLFALIFLFCSSNTFAKCQIGGKFVDDAIKFLKTVKAVNSYTFESGYPDGHKREGKVVSFQMTNKFTALRLDPNRGEDSSFVFAFDLRAESFYVYYTDGISAPFPSLIKGSVNSATCSIQYLVNETELFEVELLEGNNMNIFSKHKVTPDKGYSVIHKFNLRSDKIAN